MKHPRHDDWPATRSPADDAEVGLVMCAWCWGQRSIMEPSVFGLLPVVCRRCEGHGREARRAP